MQNANRSQVRDDGVNIAATFTPMPQTDKGLNFEF
jgi:hypothetical protein